MADGYDPYELDHELRSIITSYGGIYLDVLPSFRNVHDLQADYYAVEGHPMLVGMRSLQRCWPRGLPAARCLRSQLPPSRRLNLRKVDNHECCLFSVCGLWPRRYVGLDYQLLAGRALDGASRVRTSVLWHGTPPPSSSPTKEPVLHTWAETS